MGGLAGWGRKRQKVQPRAKKYRVCVKTYRTSLKWCTSRHASTRPKAQPFTRVALVRGKLHVRLKQAIGNKMKKIYLHLQAR